TVLQKRVPDQSATKARQDGECDKSDGIHPFLTCHDSAQHSIAEDPEEVDDAEEFANGASHVNLASAETFAVPLRGIVADGVEKSRRSPRRHPASPSGVVSTPDQEDPAIHGFSEPTRTT